MAPQELKTHKNAGSVALVIYFKALNLSEKINFVLAFIFLFDDTSAITKPCDKLFLCNIL